MFHSLPGPSCAKASRPLGSVCAECPQPRSPFASHAPALKDCEFDRAPFGILGFETAIALTLEQLVHTGKISLMRMVELFTTGPARVLGKERKLAASQPADMTLFSTTHEWKYNVNDSPSKSRNSPFDGRTFKGAPMATIVAGKI